MSQSYGVLRTIRNLFCSPRSPRHRARTQLLRHRRGVRPYQNEELLGPGARGRRDQVIVATPVRLPLRKRELAGLDSRPEQCAKWSRLRSALGTDRIDFSINTRRQAGADRRVWARWPIWFGRVGPFPAFPKRAKTTIRRAHRVYPISAVQSEYSLWERNLEDRSSPWCASSAIDWSFRSARSRFPHWHGATATEYPHGDYRRNDPRLKARTSTQTFGSRHRPELAKRKGATAGPAGSRLLLGRGDAWCPSGNQAPQVSRGEHRRADLVLTPRRRPRSSMLPFRRFHGGTPLRSTV